MNYEQVIRNGDIFLISEVKKLYGLESYIITPINSHDYGRNVAYVCKKDGENKGVIRISYQGDRSREHLLGEIEFVRDLYKEGAKVANVITSLKGNMIEEISYKNHIYYITFFEYAKGRTLKENHYKYRKDVPLTEYFFNCGKTLGKIHEISKNYKGDKQRYNFFEKYNATYIEELLPNSLSILKNKMIYLLEEAKKLDMSLEYFGLVHFDYNEGNYHIDFETGDITVFDFDNSCYCWYMYDLAGLWQQGVGWIQFEKDVSKRKQFMDEYFETVLRGYRLETELKDEMLEHLQFFIQLGFLENIIDTFEVQRNSNEDFECEEWLAYIIECFLKDIPYYGFFHDIYRTEEPFSCKAILI